MAKKLKKWQGWALFGGSMIVVFLLGLLASSLMERRAEVASVFNNKRTQFNDSIIAQNEKFKADYPREYETWAMTEDTTFESEFNGSKAVDVLEQRPNMVILWASTASTTCVRFCVPAIPVSTLPVSSSRPLAGPVKVLTFHA